MEMKIVEIEVLDREAHSIYGVTRRMMKEKIIKKYKIEKNFLIKNVISRELNVVTSAIILKIEIEVE